MARSRAAVSPDLQQVRRDLERWRRSRIRGERIPGSVWQGAAALAARHGVGRISRELRLDYYALQRRVNAADGRAGGAKVEFVEVALAQRATGIRCQVAVHDPSGGAVRLDVEGLSVGDLATLVRAFSGAAS